MVPPAALLVQEGGGDLLQTWYSPVWGKLVDELRQVLGVLRKQFLLVHARPLCGVADRPLPKRRTQLPRFDRQVLARSNPRVGDVAVPCVLQLFKETADATNQAAVWSCSPGAHALPRGCG